MSIPFDFFCFSRRVLLQPFHIDRKCCSGGGWPNDAQERSAKICFGPGFSRAEERLKGDDRRERCRIPSTRTDRVGKASSWQALHLSVFGLAKQPVSSVHIFRVLDEFNLN